MPDVIPEGALEKRLQRFFDCLSIRIGRDSSYLLAYDSFLESILIPLLRSLELLITTD